MAFGPIMRFKVSELQIELAPLTRESMSEFVSLEHGGGMQRTSVHRYLGMSTAPVQEDELAWFDKVREERSSLVWGIWVVQGSGADRERTLIGNSSLNGIGKDGHSGFLVQATTGSMIFRPEYWGKGIASAAHKARTWYAFTQLGVHRIKSAVIQANVGSRTALERSGYVRIYTERNEQYGDGKLHHLDCFECINPLDLFWSQWWHGDKPSVKQRAARAASLSALEWARQNVELP